MIGLEEDGGAGGDVGVEKAGLGDVGEEEEIDGGGGEAPAEAVFKEGMSVGGLAKLLGKWWLVIYALFGVCLWWRF